MASAKKRRWKGTRGPPRIRSNKPSPLKRKRTALSTTLPTEKGCHSSECSKAFWEKVYFGMAFASTLRPTNFQTQLPPIFGNRFLKFRDNPWGKSPQLGRNSQGSRL